MHNRSRHGLLFPFFLKNGNVHAAQRVRSSLQTECQSWGSLGLSGIRLAMEACRGTCCAWYPLRASSDILSESSIKLPGQHAKTKLELKVFLDSIVLSCESHLLSVQEHFELQIVEAAPIEAFAGFFDVQFKGSPQNPASFEVLLSTAPDPDCGTHWGQQVFHLYPSINAQPGDRISGDINISRKKENHRLMQVGNLWEALSHYVCIAVSSFAIHTCVVTEGMGQKGLASGRSLDREARLGPAPCWIGLCQVSNADRGYHMAMQNAVELAWQCGAILLLECHLAACRLDLEHGCIAQ